MIASVFLILRFFRSVIKNLRRDRDQAREFEGFDAKMKRYAQTKSMSKYPDETHDEHTARVFAANLEKEGHDV